MWEVLAEARWGLWLFAEVVVMRILLLLLLKTEVPGSLGMLGGLTEMRFRLMLLLRGTDFWVGRRQLWSCGCRRG